ncbi:hypothetical protein [Caballeronia sp. ATUFL_M2_KS44]|nr:hypothetical protein [Caballeronia sp. ATUFL_M2_KS44]
MVVHQRAPVVTVEIDGGFERLRAWEKARLFAHPKVSGHFGRFAFCS